MSETPIMLEVTARQNARERILRAADELVAEQGAAQMSLQSVAERAGVSKGGLLYHFPNKKALLRALVAAHVAEREADMARAGERYCGSRNPLLRAVIESHAVKIRKGRPPGGILAAIAADPQMIDPMREQGRRIFERLRQTACPEEAFIVSLVLEGLRAHDLFEVEALTQQERDRILAYLVDFVESGGEAGARGT